jgi:ADP-heptose:LPS heptosyltransferase
MAAPVALVLRALGLGDLITGLPALRLLRTVRPDHRLLLATPGHWAPIVARSDPAIEVLPVGELEPLAGAPEAPDLAIDLHGNGPASRDLLVPLQPRQLIAYADRRVRWRPVEHEVVRWCRLLREGLPARNAPPVAVTGILGPPPEAAVPRGRTVVHVGAAAASRRWPPERFAAVAMLLAADGHRVVVTGGPGEEKLADEVAAAARVPRVTGLDLSELLGLVGHARLVISGDTGVAHVAAAYAAPSVTLFGPVAPARWGPPRHPRHRALWHGDDSGDPHGTVVDPALLRITVGEVIAAAATALAAGRRGPRGLPSVVGRRQWSG